MYCTNILGFKIQVMNQFTRRICYEIPPTEAVLHSCNSLNVFTMCFAFAYLVAEWEEDVIYSLVIVKAMLSFNPNEK